MKSRMFLPELLQSSVIPLCLVNEGGVIFWFNKAFQDLFPSRDLTSFTLQELFLDPGLVGLLQQTPGQLDVSLGFGDSRASFSVSTVMVDPAAHEGAGILTVIAPSADAKERRDRQEFTVQAIAHDLANPVSAIFGYTDLLLEDGFDTHPSGTQLDILRKIRNTASRAIEMVKNYQILSQVDQNSLALPSSCTDMHKIVNDVLDYYWREGPEAPRLELNLSPRQVEVAAPRFAVERIFANLLTNAVKYGEREGKVRIDTSITNGWGNLRVWNSGNPIPSAEIPVLFDKFTRGAASRDIAGIGIGLYIVKTLADRCNANIDVKSSASDGTSFTVSFPVK